MGPRRALISLLAFGASLGSAAAEPSTLVRLGGTCVPDGTTPDRTLSILQAELAPVDVTRLDEVPDVRGATVVLIGVDDCTSVPPEATITVWIDGAPRRRRVSLADTPIDARDRTFALALAEATRDLALSTAPGAPADSGTAVVAPFPPNTPPAAPAEPAAPPARPDATTSVVGDSGRAESSVLPRAGALLRFVPWPSTWLGGGELGVALRRTTLSARVLGTERSVAQGTARLLVVAAAPSVNVVELLPRTNLRIGVEAGYAAGSGDARQPARGSSGGAAHFAGTVGLGTRMAVAPGLSLDGFVEGGYASSLTLRADGADLATAGGPFATLGVGLGFPLD
ncbi:MAG TPA: hypothetical protein VHE30_14975 [Polyangiaceae bacterium]|nr:hypothetical protein [Polyangiaceae bacterium]